MSPIFRSGAFIQQCFSVHPLCLSIKRLALPEQIIITCSSCNLAHRLTVRSSAIRSPARQRAVAQRTGGDLAGVDHLTPCVESHRPAVAICSVDVLQDAIGFRCAECRKRFEFDVAVFETHQR